MGHRRSKSLRLLGRAGAALSVHLELIQGSQETDQKPEAGTSQAKVMAEWTRLSDKPSSECSHVQSTNLEKSTANNKKFFLRKELLKPQVPSIPALTPYLCTE